jgi:hypothetical protein
MHKVSLIVEQVTWATETMLEIEADRRMKANAAVPALELERHPLHFVHHALYAWESAHPQDVAVW